MLRIKLFGDQVQCILHGRLIALPYRQCGWLLARLAFDLGPRHDRSVIAHDVWPDQEKHAALANLRKAVQSLSPLLDESILCRNRGQIWLNPGSVSTDLCDVERLLAQEDMDGDGLTALIGGPLFGGVSLTWANRARGRMRATVLSAPSSLSGEVRQALLEALTSNHQDRSPVWAEVRDPWRAFDKVLSWQIENSPRDLPDLLWATRSLALGASPSALASTWEGLLRSPEASHEAKGLAMVYLGNLRLWSCQHAEAARLLHRGVELLQPVHPAKYEFALGIETVLAIQSLNYGLALQNISKLRSEGVGQHLLSLVYWNRNELDRADAAMRKVDICHDRSDLDFQLQIVANLAMLNIEMGNIPEFYRQNRRVQELRKGVRHRRLEVYADLINAVEMRTHGDPAHSLSILDACLQKVKRDAHGMPWLHDESCMALILLGRFDEAIDHLVAASKLRKQAAVATSTPTALRIALLKRRLVERVGADGLASAIQARLG